MKKIVSSKELQDFIDSVANIGKSNIPDDDGMVYYSKIDGSFLTRVGMEKEIEFLLKRGITEQLQDRCKKSRVCCIGFNPIEQKWYGWSHRAIFGFGIGSECKKGNCGYLPSNKKDFMEREISFWGDCEYALNGAVDCVEIVGGVIISYVFNQEVPNIKLRGKRYEHFSKFPKKWGKGEWTAKTLEDAKQMAIDFADSVS